MRSVRSGRTKISNYGTLEPYLRATANLNILTEQIVIQQRQLHYSRQWLDWANTAVRASHLSMQSPFQIADPPPIAAKNLFKKGMVTCFDLRDESLTFHRHQKTMKTWSWGSSVKSLIKNYWVGQLSVWLADKRAGVSVNNHDTEKQNCAQMRSLSVARILSPVPRPWPFQVFVEGLP